MRNNVVKYAYVYIASCIAIVTVGTFVMYYFTTYQSYNTSTKFGNGFITKEDVINEGKSFTPYGDSIGSDFEFLKYNGTRDGNPQFIAYHADPSSEEIGSKIGVITFRSHEYLSGGLVDRFVWTVGKLVAPPCNSVIYYLDAKSGEIVAKFYSSCPGYCLSGNTSIETPNGQINIKELKAGMIVWTSDGHGNKQSAIILKTGEKLAPLTHMMVHVVLDDGRELFASLSHPTADNRLFEDLSKGDILDNSHVKSIELVPYDENYTYDVLPSGSTGFYWANGILVGSTLQ